MERGERKNIHVGIHYIFFVLHLQFLKAIPETTFRLLSNNHKKTEILLPSSVVNL